MTTDTKDPKEKKISKSAKLFSYHDLMDCVRYYQLFALMIPGEIERERIDLVRGWIEEKKPQTFCKLFPKKGATHA